MKLGTADNSGGNEICVAQIPQNSYPSKSVHPRSKNHVGNTRIETVSKGNRFVALHIRFD